MWHTRYVPSYVIIVVIIALFAKDFRSQDGLYALLNLENDEPTQVPAGTASESVNEDTQTRRRSSRTKASPAHRAHAHSEHHLVDPQEIFDINVFRSYPQVF